MAGRVILVTGATRGLGRAMVAGMIAAGQTIVGCGRSSEAVDALRKEYGSPHRFDVVDVASDCAVAEWADVVLKAGLVPDLLVNNAAVMNETKPLWEISGREFQQMIDINIAGVANVIRHFVPAMIERQRGVIVNFSSGWGRSTSPDVAPYCATKFAIEGLTMALSQELPQGMAAIPLNPGIIDTDMLRSCWADGASAYPTADEWAEVAVPYLLKLSARDNGRQLAVPV
ncbi:SDR family NAD(P)-dependent oxidoreductase [bacterium]|nr:SDR family NAD(P)-dependent oxidoreductase [bacterium]